MSSIPINVWTDWRTASAWQRKDIPDCPGVYEVRCVDEHGMPVPLPIAPGYMQSLGKDGPARAARQVHRLGLAGVVYIGMSTDLRARFWRLIRSWRDGRGPAKPHGSRVKWDSDKELQSAYPRERLQFRWMRIGSRSRGTWTSPSAPQHIGIARRLWPDDGTDHDHPSAAAGIAVEDKLLKQYCMMVGSLPPLNTDPPERGGEPVDEEFLDWWADSQRGEQAVDDEAGASPPPSRPA